MKKKDNGVVSLGTKKNGEARIFRRRFFGYVGTGKFAPREKVYKYEILRVVRTPNSWTRNLEWCACPESWEKVRREVDAAIEARIAGGDK